MMRHLTNGEFYIFSFAVVILNCMDAITTHIGLGLGGIEINPMFSATIPYLLYKLFSISLFVVILGYVHTKYTKMKLGTEIAILMMFGIYTAVFVNNILVIINQLNTVLI